MRRLQVQFYRISESHNSSEFFGSSISSHDIVSEIELLFFGRIEFNFECQGDTMPSNEFSTRLKQAMSEAG